MGRINKENLVQMHKSTDRSRPTLALVSGVKILTMKAGASDVQCIYYPRGQLGFLMHI